MSDDGSRTSVSMLTANLHEHACLQANSLVFDVDRFIHLCIFFFVVVFHVGHASMSVFKV